MNDSFLPFPGDLRTNTVALPVWNHEEDWLDGAIWIPAGKIFMVIGSSPTGMLRVLSADGPLVVNRVDFWNRTTQVI